jgi:hypothetical protein
MRVLSSSLTGLACIASLMTGTATPATSQPSALSFEQGKLGRVQLVEYRDRRNGYARPRYRGYGGRYYGPYYAPYAYYGPYYGPYYYPYYRPYYGPSVSFSFGF